ncbi:unnamed protein product, partial [Ixodes hexagonus]
MIDTVKMSIEDRFTQMEQHVSLWGILYVLTRLPDKAGLLKLCQALDHALRHLESADIDGTDLCEELIYICSLLPSGCSAPRDVLQFILDTHLRDNFPYTWVALRILLTLPVSVATAERSFSKLKLIKTYLRSAMA